MRRAFQIVLLLLYAFFPIHAGADLHLSPEEPGAHRHVPLATAGTYVEHAHGNQGCGGEPGWRADVSHLTSSRPQPSPTGRQLHALFMALPPATQSSLSGNRSLFPSGNRVPAGLWPGGQEPLWLRCQAIRA